MKKIEVCTINELNSSVKKVVIADGKEILIIYSDGKYYAVDNICPHAKSRLFSGRVEDGTLTCSSHGTCFDLETGAIRIDKIDEDLRELIDVDNLPFGPLKTFSIWIENGMVVIGV